MHGTAFCIRVKVAYRLAWDSICLASVVIKEVINGPVSHGSSRGELMEFSLFDSMDIRIEHFCSIGICVRHVVAQRV